ncbi:2-aminoadipate aminotransferase [Acrasis kona]|uniref:2-aminoadipate aminotransferase n=1 Tax=Acrasis kona TaxID=1008807 RepID=A0AAW2Z321_9EUKA
MNYTRFLSKVSQLREPSPIRYLIANTKNMYRLAGGLPNPDSFPVKGITLHLNDNTDVKFEASDMLYALQYSNTEGIRPMVEWIMEHQRRKHIINHDNWDVVVTTGSQDALSKAFEMLIDAGQGDVVLVENPSYTGALAALHPLQPKLLTIPIDGDGIIPEQLEIVLKNHFSDKNPKPIKFLYTIPTGQNPSGATLTVQRKKQIYKLAQQYNFLILEDDPYFYLNLEESGDNDSMTTFLSMDVDGRVLRFDSLSKVLSSGLRIGWLTAHKTLIDRIHLHMQTSSLHTSGLSQKVASKLLSKVWGQEGFDNHVRTVRKLYRGRRDEFLGYVDKHLGEHVSYNKPKAGMFVWLKFNHIPDAKQFIEERTREKRVLLVPGQAFDPHYKPSPYARASYSVESSENMEAACKALGSLCEEYKK